MSKSVSAGGVINETGGDTEPVPCAACEREMVSSEIMVRGGVRQAGSKSVHDTHRRSNLMLRVPQLIRKPESIHR